jgi:hypothetical protein
MQKKNKRVYDPSADNNELAQLDSYYQDLMRKERDTATKALVSKLAIQRMDLERKFSGFMKKAETKLRKAEAMAVEF